MYLGLGRNVTLRLLCHTTLSARVLAYYFKQFSEQKQINKHKTSNKLINKLTL